MTITAIILSSLALLAAASNLVITLRERKRSQKRKTALMQYAKACADSVRSELGPYIDRHSKGLDERISTLSKRVDDLEKGVVPDFEKAKAAAEAVNDFNAGISGILGFDPHEVLKRQRSEGYGGEQL